MYGYTDQQPDNQKKKIIIVSLVMGIIIVVLIGVLINAIVKKNHLVSETAQNETVDDSAYVVNENGDLVAVTESSKEEEKPAEDGKADPVEGEATAAVTPSSDVKSEIPATGAEGVLGFALLMGTITTFALSKSKRFAF